MKVIIAGAGEIGEDLARRLTLEHHDVVVLEKDSEKIPDIEDKLDVMVVQETGERISALIDAGIKEADVFIAVTNSDELNIMFCMIAKKLADIKTVARVRNPEYYNRKDALLSSDQLGIDIMINPEGLAALEIAKLIESPEASEIEYFAEGKIELLAFKIERDSELVNKRIDSISMSKETLIIAISRENGEVIIPRGKDQILLNDVIYVIKKAGTLTHIASMASGKKKRARSVMIIGGGKIGFRLAKILENHEKNGMSIKLVERSPERCKIISEYLNKTLVLNGDATDINFLRDENIETSDIVVTVTGSDELNILTAILAKKLGATKAITGITKPGYEVVLQALEIDSYVSPRLLTVSKLAKLFRKSNIISETFLKDGKAEMLEVIVPSKSSLLDIPLSRLRLLDKGIIIGGILRGGKAIIPKGKDVILAGDRLIVFTNPQNVKEVEHLFS